ncbi:MAG TPA: dTDP-4-dehydrorhamnose 3,5-epimerase [bacterium]|nr:dTDP-4-dehydrorhamnose 3,5-epimerase [bacterium]
MPFRFERLEIPDLILIESTVLPDGRGFFMETYKRSEFVDAGISATFLQDNYSHSTGGVLRGLHYQKHPRAQAKLVTVLHGEIFDVAVDIRRGSPTFQRWVAVTLSAGNRRMLYVPVGFAHGFCTLSDQADVVYRVTAEYAPDADRGILWNDPDLQVTWPIPHPVLSPKDARLPLFRDADSNFVYEPHPS